MSDIEKNHLPSDSDNDDELFEKEYTLNNVRPVREIIFNLNSDGFCVLGGCHTIIYDPDRHDDWCLERYDTICIFVGILMKDNDLKEHMFNGGEFKVMPYSKATKEQRQSMHDLCISLYEIE